MFEDDPADRDYVDPYAPDPMISERFRNLIRKRYGEIDPYAPDPTINERFRTLLRKRYGKAGLEHISKMNPNLRKSKSKR